MMQVIPAIDLRGGRVVRLRQGDYGQETIFGDEPAAWASRWRDEGASRLHLVDLDGARDGASANQEAVRAILDAVEIPCQLGGGIRTERDIASWLEAGIDRVIAGTKALTDPSWLRAMSERYPRRLVLGLDARDGRVATRGWLDVSDVEALELAKQFDDLPLAAIIYTDIAKDGMLQGPNFEATEALARQVRLPVIASGGVGRLEDIERLAALPLEGCIVGRALYDGCFRFREARERAGDRV